MSKIFKMATPGYWLDKAKPPAVAPPPPPPAPPITPTIDDARQRQLAADSVAGRRGRAASILTGAAGDLSTPPTTGTKTLLGG
jgi:hypothetical protein